jgi:hypothetical protein
MKYITLIIGLLVVGCGTLKDKVIGTYEGEGDGYAVRAVLHKNGIYKGYRNGKKEVEDGKWSISKDGELHLIEAGDTVVFRINTKDNLGTRPVSSITLIANIADGKRTDIPKGKQQTIEKIK